MTASEIRALFAVASRPEVVSLAGGMPYTTALPLDSVGKLMSDLMATRGAQALQYGSGQGDPVLRELICEVMSLEGVTRLARGRRRHGRLAAGARPGDPGLLRPG